MTRAISLDFWGTIAVFNPKYSAARTDLIAETFDLPRDEAHARYQAVKRRCDQKAERNGAAVTPLVAVRRVIGKDNACPVEFLERLENLVRRHPPLLHPQIRETLLRLKDRGITVGVSSNTNFIAGSLVQSIFGLPWDFAVYSDEIGVSKPSRDFFKTVLLRTGAQAENVLHIGDNSVCDVGGAQSIGFKARLVKSPDQTMECLNEYI